jgi:TPR repeat protein
VAQAQNELGAMYLSGEGVSRDPAEAFHWFQLAAQQALPDAQNNLGYLYSTGQGTTRDYQQALRWFGLAARQGLPSAEVNMGALYMTGRGVPLDYVAGYMWLSLAAEQGSKTAEAARKSFSTIMTKDQLAAAELRLEEWKQQHPAPLEQVQAR